MLAHITKGFLMAMVITLAHIMLCEIMHLPIQSAFASAAVTVTILLIAIETCEVNT